MTKKFLTTALFCAACLACAQNSGGETSSANIENSMQNKALQAPAADPNLRLETLANGFLVAVYPNAEPPGRVSMRLLVRRGSAVEKPGEEGLAHFIEHMAFNGTTNFPKGDMVEYFQRLGMAFGADTNAHTSFSETVYKIDMPSNDPKMVADGLTLLGDYASGVLFPREEIERERGVIIAEKKARDTAGYRASVDLIRTLFPDSPFADRFPIGEESVIQSAPRSAFVDFYNAHYRPENMALVVVGDVDADSVLARARKMLSGVRGAGSGPDSAPLPAYRVVRTEPVRASLVQDADMRDSSAGIYMASVPEHHADSVEKRIRSMRLETIAKIISLRFDARKSAPDSRFSSAYADFGGFENYADIFSIGARSTVGGSEGALEEVVKMYMGALSNGFGEWELEKAKSEILNYLESEVRGKSTRKTPELASAITSMLSEGDVVTSPETDLEIAKASFEGFDARAASEMFRDLVGRSQVFSQMRDVPGSGNPADAKYVFERLVAGGGDIAFSSPLVGSDLEFADFGKPGAVAAESVDELGVRRLEFENGVRANLKKTDFAKDEVIVNISFGGGRLDLPEGKAALASVAPGFILGGTSAQTFDEINVAKSDRNMDLAFSADGDAFVFTAKTSPKYLRDALSLMSTYMREPAFRAEAAAPLKKIVDARYRQLETNPDMSLAKIDGWLTGGNDRLRFPEKSEVEAVGMDDLRAWLEPILKNSYMEISIAGDFDEEGAKAVLAEAFASMPGREKSRRDYSKEREVRLTSEKEAVFRVKSVNDARSYAVKAWITCDRSDLKKMRAANLLGAVLNEAVRKIVRESSGKVYSPFAYNNSNPAFDFGAMVAISDVAPEFNGEVVGLLEESAKSVARGVSEDEFERAKLPLLKQVEKTRRTNSYWANSALPMIQSDPLKFETARTFESGYRDVTLEDVRKAAAEYLKDRDGYTVRVMPAE